MFGGTRGGSRERRWGGEEAHERVVQVRDMVEMLEISGGARKMLHAPSLGVFVVQVISRDASRDRARLSELVSAWRRAAQREPGRLVGPECAFYDPRTNAVLLCSRLQAYPFLVA